MSCDPATTPFTVLIPTLNRGATLVDTLATCLEQEDLFFRILVSDNHSTDGTKEIVEAFAKRDPRVQLISPPVQLPMSQHWTWALDRLGEGFFMVLGADDGLVPGAVTRARACLEEYPETGAIVGSWALYIYPDLPQSNAGYLTFQCLPGKEFRESETWLRNLANSECGPGELPMPYSMAFVRNSVLKDIIARSGSLIRSPTPDYYLCVAVTAMIHDFVFLRQPLAIAGISTASNGAKCLSPKESGSLARGASFVRQGDIVWHKSIPYVGSWHVILGEAILQAKEAMLIDKSIEIRWDRISAQAYYDLRNADWSKEDAETLFASLKELSNLTGFPNLFEGVSLSETQSLNEKIKTLCENWIGAPFDIEIDARNFGAKNISHAAQLVGKFLADPDEKPNVLNYSDASNDEISRMVLGKVLSNLRAERKKGEELAVLAEQLTVELGRVRSLSERRRERIQKMESKFAELKDKISELKNEVKIGKAFGKRWWPFRKT